MGDWGVGRGAVVSLEIFCRRNSIKYMYTVHDTYLSLDSFSTFSQFQFWPGNIIIFVYAFALKLIIENGLCLIIILLDNRQILKLLYLLDQPKWNSLPILIPLLPVKWIAFVSCLVQIHFNWYVSWKVIFSFRLLFYVGFLAINARHSHNINIQRIFFLIEFHCDRREIIF